MEDASLEDANLLALRRSPGSRPHQLAEAAGLPRTNFGRQLQSRLRRPLERLLAEGLVVRERDRHSRTEDGRERLSQRIGASR